MHARPTPAALATLLLVLSAGACGGGSGTAADLAAATPDVPGRTIPDGFPLADGLPAHNGDDGSPVQVTRSAGLDDLVLCGEDGWTAYGTADVAGVVFTGEAEDVRARTLALYADAPAAAAALERLRTTVAACPEGTVGGTDQVYEEVDRHADASFWTHRYRSEGRFDTGLEVLQAVRVGPALYLASYYGEGGGSAASIERSLDVAAEESSGVVAALPDLGD